jgi:translation initiation factor IF-2
MSNQNKAETKTNAQFRTPIVAVMGHVDHGKTSLLDAIRDANVTASEHGGITQNTRAHQITTKNGNKITFIDTPGHEAFSAMRARGAEVTDFVMLVVAADDGVQPQTKESIEFAKSTNTPIILVINKIDIPGVKIDKVKQEVASFGVNIEEYGGETMVFLVSATKKQGLEELIDGVELLSEINELKLVAPRTGVAGEAYVLESTLDKRLGAVALTILKAGNLDSKMFGVNKNEYFRVRSYLDQNQKPTEQVNESDPFWITGLKKPASTGETMYFVEDEKAAKSLQEELATAAIVPVAVTENKAIDPNSLLFQMLSQKQAETEGTSQKILHVIIKASTQGTLEAVKNELEKLGDEEKTIRVLTAETGEVTENDIKKAKNAGGIVISFQMPANAQVLKLARQEKVIVRNYEIIYEMVDELSGALDGLIEPPEEEIEVARARVKQVFVLTNGDIVAGCEVIKGNMLKGYPIYVERPKLSTKDAIAEIGRGKISSLRVLKDEVKEAKKGQECGILIAPPVADIQSGDEIVAYKVE